MKYVICVVLFTTICFGSGLGRAADGSFPGFPFENVKIGMPKEALERSNREIKFADIGGFRSVGVLKHDGRTILFYIENDKLIQISYGWGELREEAQKSKTQQLTGEFTTRFGRPAKFERKRAVGNSDITVAALQFNISSSEVAVIESWGKSITITIRSAREMAETEQRLGAGHQKFGQDSQTDESIQRPGVENFGKEKLKKPKEPSLDTVPKVIRDYIKEID